MFSAGKKRHTKLHIIKQGPGIILKLPCQLANVPVKSETQVKLWKIIYKEGNMGVISKEMETLLATGSTLRTMFEEGKRLAKEYGAENVYDFSLGNPSVPAPEEFNEAIKSVVDENDSFALHAYMSNPGYEETRQAIADDLNSRFGSSYSFANICMTVGAANAIVVAMKILTGPGDEVAVFAPFFLEYRNYISNFGAKCTIVPPNPPSFMPDPNALRSTLTENTKAVIINNHNNPNGVIYPKSVIKEITAVLEEAQEKYGHPIFIISDEPYRELVYGKADVPFIPDYYKNTLIAYSYSKSLAIPGERVGYLAIPDCADEAETLKAAMSIGIRVLGCVNAPSLQQKAIIKALSSRADTTQYEKNRELLLGGLKKAGFSYVEPDGAFYVFMMTPTEDDNEFVERAKNKYRILTASGSSFYCPGYVRLAYCVSEDMIKRALPYFELLGKDYGLC